MDGISLIVSSHNNNDEVFQFVKIVDTALRCAKIAYEIIFIDAESTDLTQHTISRLSQLYPVRYIICASLSKTHVVKQAAKKARYSTLGTIAIQEYSPLILPTMLEKITQGYHVVIARRIWKNTQNKQSFWKSAYATICGKKLYHLDVDFASELKLFRREILEKLMISSQSSFLFDFEFLIRAKKAGYTIAEVPLLFEKYFAEQRQEHPLTSLFRIALKGINLKFTNPDLIPIEKGDQGFRFKGNHFIHFSLVDPSDSAFFPLAGNQKKALLFSLFILLISFVINWKITIISFFTALTVIYFLDLLFNYYLIIQSFTQSPEIDISDTDAQQLQDFPSYTIFCPLYKESIILPQFIHAIQSLDYPKGKLQVILLLEEDDTETLNTIQYMLLPSYFEIRIPPQSYPKTKPKALNFGLQFAKGEYCVVYDAEDIPDPLQLRKVLIAFQKTDKNVQCIQAKLNFYNPLQNLLTRVFTAEYSLWFDLILTGLQSSESIIPLGGTSNHFRTENLRNIHGWDSFNVTEDCDLGVRIIKHGFKTAIVNSTTLEEANSDLRNWFYQRSRWIKGYIQTYLVHTRNPKHFIQRSSLLKFIVFQFVIGGKVMPLFINPIMWSITIIYFVFRSQTGMFIESLFPAPIQYMGDVCLVFGNFLYLYYYMIGCAKRGQYGLIKYAYLVPLYWLGMSVSAWYALYMIITNPHHWAKTPHGLHFTTIKKQTVLETARLTIQPQISL